MSSYIRKTVNGTTDFEVEMRITQDDVIRYIENSGASGEELKAIIRTANGEIDVEIKFKVETLDDEMKLEPLQKMFKQFSSFQIENILKLSSK